MKKQIITLLSIFIGLSTYAQKDQIKAAEKALKSGDVATAKSSVDQAEGLIANADNKIKANFYFVKAKTYYDVAKKNPSLDPNAYDTAAKSFQKLISFEKEIGKNKYTEEAQPLLNALADDLSEKGLGEFRAENFNAAKNSLYLRYKLREQDTVYLYYSAHAAYGEKDYDLALEYFRRLKDIGYTGVTKVYKATNVETGNVETWADKSQRDIMVKTNEFKDPVDEVSDSSQPNIYKSIAFILNAQGEVDEALIALKEARQIAPMDSDILTTEANIYFKQGKDEEFLNAMLEAIEQDPNNAILHFNVGVMYMKKEDLEGAKEKFNKALELDPNYSDAYINLGAIELEKDKEYQEGMNNNLSNFKKFDEFKAKQKELYKEVLPLYEKAYSLNKESMTAVQMLMSLYENLEMDDKFKEMKALWDARDK